MGHPCTTWRSDEYLAAMERLRVVAEGRGMSFPEAMRRAAEAWCEAETEARYNEFPKPLGSSSTTQEPSMNDRNTQDTNPNRDQQIAALQAKSKPLSAQDQATLARLIAERDGTPHNPNE